MNTTITTDNYATAKPFPCAVLDGLDLISDQLLKGAANEIEGGIAGAASFRYDNPIEKKIVLGGEGLKTGRLGEIVKLLSSDDWLDFLSEMTDIRGLHSDPSLYGAGLSIVQSGGFLALHRDLEIHPISHLERRINLALFLTPSWHDEWGGHLEFWRECGGKPTSCARRIRPTCGRIVLFDPQGYHGFPEPILCPENSPRISLQMFYYSAPRAEKVRTRAWFSLRPGEDYGQKLNDFRLVGRRE